MDASELEEERGLCYVAITRAKKKLYLLNARQRMLFLVKSKSIQLVDLFARLILLY